MKRVQIYIRPEDEEMWEEARRLIPETSLAQTIAAALRGLLDRRRAETEGYEEVVLHPYVGARQGLGGEDERGRQVRFMGKLLAVLNRKGQGTSTDWKLYRTRGGRYVVEEDAQTCWEGARCHLEATAYDSLADIPTEPMEGVPSALIVEAENALQEQAATWVD
jgi:hypothetical protein